MTINGLVLVNREQGLAGLAEFMSATKDSMPNLAFEIINSQLDHKQLLAVLTVGQLMYSWLGYHADQIKGALHSACKELGWPSNFVYSEIAKYQRGKVHGLTDFLPVDAGTTSS